MDEIEGIRERLKAAAQDSEEEKQLLALFDRACQGLSGQDSDSAKREIKGRLDELHKEFKDRADDLMEIIKR